MELDNDNVTGFVVDFRDFSNLKEFTESLMNSIISFKKFMNINVQSIILNDHVTRLSYHFQFKRFKEEYIKMMMYTYMNKGNTELNRMTGRDTLDKKPFTEMYFDNTLKLTVTNLKDDED